MSGSLVFHPNQTLLLDHPPVGMPNNPPTLSSAYLFGLAPRGVQTMPNKIVVAIDLGTSRSACVFSTQGHAQNDVINRVPEGSLPYKSAMKTDTAVLLNKSTHPHDVLAFGRAASKRFIDESDDDED